MSTLHELATKIARQIFSLGDEEYDRPCTRIQFKGGQWPDNETNQGGIGEEPLAIMIEKILSESGVQL